MNDIELAHGDYRIVAGIDNLVYRNVAPIITQHGVVLTRDGEKLAFTRDYAYIDEVNL